MPGYYDLLGAMMECGCRSGKGIGGAGRILTYLQGFAGPTLVTRAPRHVMEQTAGSTDNLRAGKECKFGNSPRNQACASAQPALYAPNALAYPFSVVQRNHSD